MGATAATRECNRTTEPQQPWKLEATKVTETESGGKEADIMADIDSNANDNGEVKGGDASDIDKNGEADEMMDDLADIEVPIHIDSTTASTSFSSGHHHPHDSLITPADAHAPSVANGWDNNAIISCFELAITAHSMSRDALVGEGRAQEADWEPGPNVRPKITTAAENTANNRDNGNINAAGDSTSKSDAIHSTSLTIEDKVRTKQGGRWKPRPVPLPGWAVDPVYAASHLDTSTK